MTSTHPSGSNSLRCVTEKSGTDRRVHLSGLIAYVNSLTGAGTASHGSREGSKVRRSKKRLGRIETANLRTTIGRMHKCIKSVTTLTCALLLLTQLRTKYSYKRCDVERSAVYTPYDLTPGGGEKVLISVVAALQRLTGCDVVVLVERKNSCREKNCLRKLTTQLSVSNLDVHKVKFRIRTKKRHKYLVFFAMGNSFMPSLRNRGHFGIYHCQFPFDSQDPRLGKQTSLVQLASYDAVYLNSQYTASWYGRMLRNEQRVYSAVHGKSLKLPTVLHFPPPVNLSPTDTNWKLQSEHKILLVGRFFDGPQGKRHLDAIKAFERLRVVCSCQVELYLVGHSKPRDKGYVTTVRVAAKKVTGVHVVESATVEQLFELYMKSTIIWSITGIGKAETTNPADAEHFGISLVEGMGFGLIPIVINKGGPVEIVEEIDKGLIINDIHELVNVTNRIISLPEGSFKTLRDASVQRADSLNVFHDRFDSIFNLLGVQLQPSTRLLWKALCVRIRAVTRRHGAIFDKPVPHTERYAVLYVETRYDFSLRANVLNLRTALGDDWSFHIWHVTQNEFHMKTLLDGLNFIQFHSLDNFIEGNLDPRKEGSYQTLFKSKSFWSILSPYARVLTFQSDSWFHSTGFDQSWLNTDYIGAPWCLEGNSVYLPRHERPAYDEKMLHTTRKLDQQIRVGNGGVSIRSTTAMLDIIARYSNESDVQENEDVFTVSSLLQGGFQVADITQAAMYSLECLCSDIDHHKDIVKEWRRLSNLPLKVALREGYEHYSFALHKPKEVFNRLLSISGTSMNRDLVDLFIRFFIY